MYKGKKLKVLSLEDNREDAELMERELRKGGLKFEVRRVWTKEALFRELKDFCPDLIIADFTLPAYDGLKALDDVRKKCRDVPFIFLTGTMGEEFAIDTLKSGATDYVLKGHVSRLVPAVSRALREHEERKERRLAEESLRESEEKFKGLAASAQDAIITMDAGGKISYWNESAARMFGYSAEEILGRELHALLTPDRYSDIYRKGFEHFRETGQGPFIGKLLNLVALKKDGTEFPVEFSVSAFQMKGEWHAISILRDITERKKAEEMLHRQLEHMTAIRDIDLAISSSFDLRVTLSILLEKLIARLGVDAADLLLMEKDTFYLNYTAGLGFRSAAIRKTRVRLGKGNVGRAALERRTLIIPDLSETVTRALKGEEFKSYIAVPLIVQGAIKGVLEIFHRKRLDPDSEWLGFLELLAGQAAIAIDRAAMFESLQKSNMELILSYDVTIEGWGRTLEFRDEDTKGHTERVAEKTLNLAKLMGVQEQDLVHVRRGALLHDIGKICIPDRILLKPDRLNEEENEIMKRHPVYAYDLLSAIPFLRPALDIPYCHHEKWDGTGYPRGLKGEDIPFHARIFAIIDVTDALLSERPYRPAWPKGKTYQYVKAQKGTHFDPKVVEAFLDMKWG